VVSWTLAALGRLVDSVTIIGQESDRDSLYLAAELADCSIRFTQGGATRQESVSAGVSALSELAQDDDIVVVHDGARPLVSAAVIERCITSARLTGSGIAALPVYETLKRAPGGCIATGIDRTDVWSMQTPQAFQYGILSAAHARALSDCFVGTDEASLVERLGLDGGVHLVEGSRENVKITRPDDIVFAENWMRRTPRLRVGTGYDIHALAPGRELWLGGVKIEHDLGLLGHSDADVVLHAICDALLGAAGLPDIGQLYPNTDRRYAGAPSIEFVRDVRSRLHQAGWQVVNVDCTLIAERPKIASRTADMRTVISAALGVAIDAVNVKATTNEGIGSLGAGEGIACQATASIMGIDA